MERCANASMSSLLGDPQWCASFQAIRIFLIKFDHAVF
ncbi:hypothetical protein N403_07590 [Helicobacter pylori FD430]|nr:hypothetical protein N403_07590 [Helicobacter pylori FD430]EQL66133.1 hypothetical protein N408_08330 [Helicobacter pylori FD703]